MKAKTAQKSRIKRLIEKYESNRQYILRIATITDEKYDEVFFEAGCMFIEHIFPEAEGLAKLATKHSRKKEYWLWWKAEWMKWESEFVDYLLLNSNKRSRKEWFEQMAQMAFDGNTEVSFYNNYLKHNK